MRLGVWNRADATNIAIRGRQYTWRSHAVSIADRHATRRRGRAGVGGRQRRLGLALT